MGKIKQQKGGFQSKACTKDLKDAIKNYNIKPDTTAANMIDNLLLSVSEPNKSKPLESCGTKEECQSICVSYTESIPTINRLQNEIYLLNNALDILTNIYNEKNYDESLVNQINLIINTKIEEQVSLNDNKILLNPLNKSIVKDNIDQISVKLNQKVSEILILSKSNYLIKNTNDYDAININKDFIDSRYIELPCPNKYKHRNYVNNNTAKYVHMLANSPLLRDSNKKYKLLKDAYDNVIDYNKDIDKIQFLDPPSFGKMAVAVAVEDKEKLEEKLRYGQYELNENLDFQYEGENKIFKKVPGGLCKNTYTGNDCKVRILVQLNKLHQIYGTKQKTGW